MNAATWWKHLGFRHQLRPVSATTDLMIAEWDDTTRLRSRGHLLWLAQQLAEARRAAQAARDEPDTPLVDLIEALELAVPPQVRTLSPDSTEQLITVMGQTRHKITQHATAAARSRRKILAAVTADLTAAAEAMDRACNDVSGADLRETDLSYVHLGGIRWTASTQWPAAWAERIRAASTNTAGTYQIRDDC